MRQPMKFSIAKCCCPDEVAEMAVLCARLGLVLQLQLPGYDCNARIQTDGDNGYGHPLFKHILTKYAFGSIYDVQHDNLRAEL